MNDASWGDSSARGLAADSGPCFWAAPRRKNAVARPAQPGAGRWVPGRFPRFGLRTNGNDPGLWASGRRTSVEVVRAQVTADTRSSAGSSSSSAQSRRPRNVKGGGQPRQPSRALGR